MRASDGAALLGALVRSLKEPAWATARPSEARTLARSVGCSRGLTGADKLPLAVIPAGAKRRAGTDRALAPFPTSSLSGKRSRIAAARRTG
jgi:hypothetical protein